MSSMSQTQPGRGTFFTCAVLFFVSGAAAIIYEVLWMKELSVLFGNSTQAAAAVLAAFFAGLAAGNRFWGARTGRMNHPLKTFALLELAVASGALLYFLILKVYHHLYGWLFESFYEYQFLFTSLKFVAAFVLLFPATFFMGGTLPVMAQFLVRNSKQMGEKAAYLYAVNTVGAAMGAFAVGFFLPQRLGYTGSYVFALACTLTTAMVAAVLARKAFVEKRKEDALPIQVSTAKILGSTAIYTAVASGVATMMLQVLWIRMFSQVLQNSIYTFSAILVTFLIALAIGGMIAGYLAKREFKPESTLAYLLTLGGVFAAASPLVFYQWTHGLRYLGGQGEFWPYLMDIFTAVAVVVGLPVCVMGTVFPYLFKVVEKRHSTTGDLIGRLVTLNTLGGIAGSILGGFVILSYLGLWSGIRLAAGIYLLTALLVITYSKRAVSHGVRLAPLAGILLLITVLDSNRLPVVKLDPVKKGETLLKVWEDSAGTVAVVRRNNHLATKLNNWYTLGGTGDIKNQQVQTHLPMLLHESPKNVFFLGMGTGITAGTALKYPVETVVVAELAPAAIAASREFFEPHTNGLFRDARVKIAAEDGRNFIRGTRKTFDLIISDLFIPWKAGTGSLYSREHYQKALEKMNPGGLYAQWIPLFQVTDEEFFIIAKTMAEVFPQVTIWRGNFHSSRPVMALIGHAQKNPLSKKAPIWAQSRQALLESQETLATIPAICHFVGVLDKNDPQISSRQLNTDAFPVIEQIAPVNHRREKAGTKQWFINEPLFDYMANFLDWSRLEKDPYLQDLPKAWLHAIQAGYYVHSIRMLKDLKHSDVATAEQEVLRLFNQTLHDLRAPSPSRPD